MTPILPLFILLVGTGAILIGLVPNFRLTGVVAVGVILVTLLVTLFMGLRLPLEVTLSTWEPMSLFPRPLRFTADGLSWLFAVAVLLVTLAVFATDLAEVENPRIGGRMLTMLITAAALSALFSDNLIAIAISWTVLDALYLISLALLNDSKEVDDTVQLTVGLNLLSSVLIVAAALAAINEGRSGLLSDQGLPQLATLLVLGAGLLRLGVFPFHAQLPNRLRVGLGIGALLRLAPAAVALELLSRVALLPEPLIVPLAPWLTALATLAILYGAVQWWVAPYPPAGLPFLVLAQSSLGVLILIWGGEMAGLGLAMLGLALILGGGVLFLSNQAQSGLWRIPVAMSVVLLAGLPFTVGYTGLQMLYLGLMAQGILGWLVLILILMSQAVLVAGALRLTFFDGLDEPLPPLGWVKAGYLFALILPLTFAFLLGIAPGITARVVYGSAVTLPGFDPLVLAMVVIPPLLGLALWYFERIVRSSADRLWDALNNISQLDWLYRTLIDLYNFIGRVLSVLGRVLEGEGGVLWTLVLALLAWLLFTGS